MIIIDEGTFTNIDGGDNSLIMVGGSVKELNVRFCEFNGIRSNSNGSVLNGRGFLFLFFFFVIICVCVCVFIYFFIVILVIYLYYEHTCIHIYIYIYCSS